MVEHERNAAAVPEVVEIVAKRYERGSTPLTTNQLVTQWGRVGYPK